MCGHKAEPGSKVPAALECAKIGSKGEDRAGGHGADAGNGAKSTHIFIRLGCFSKLQNQPVDRLGQQPDLVQVKLANLSDSKCMFGRCAASAIAAASAASFFCRLTNGFK